MESGHVSRQCACSKRDLHMPLWVYRQPPTQSSIITVQACISHLRGLTSLKIHYIETPFQPARLDNMLACLTALEDVSLEFRKGSDPAAAQTGRYRPSPLAFPCSLLR